MSRSETTALPFTRTSKHPLRGFSAFTETVARPASAFSRAAARVLNAPTQRGHTRGLMRSPLLALRRSLEKKGRCAPSASKLYLARLHIWLGSSRLSACCESTPSLAVYCCRTS